MAVIQKADGERVFRIPKWLGLHESPDGDTRLEYGEAARMENWLITRDGNLRRRPGTRSVLGLGRSYTLRTETEVREARRDWGTGPVLMMTPEAEVSPEGFPRGKGMPEAVAFREAERYLGWYWQEDMWHLWTLAGTERQGDDYVWRMRRVRAVSSAGRVAGLWKGKIRGRDYVLAACDGRLWAIRENGLWCRKELGPVNTEKTVHMFGFAGKCWVLDGEQYRVWDGSTLTPVEGYTPVVLIAVTPEGAGTTLEAVNKLSPRRRVWFSPDGKAAVFRLPETGLRSVDMVVNRGTGTEMTGVTADPAGGTVTFESAPEAGINTVEVSYTAAECYREAVDGMRFSELFNGLQDSRVFLYGDGSHQILYSGLDRSGQPRADYFPDLNTAAIGTENTPVTGLIRHGSRMLAFKTDECYAVTYGAITLEDGKLTAGFYVEPVNRSIGCEAIGQVTLVQNAPRTLHGGNCYEWKSYGAYGSHLARDERQARCISQRVYRSLGEMDPGEALCWDDDRRQEYYIISGGTALVHNYAVDVWYKYTDFDAVCMLADGEDRIIGTPDGRIALLDDREVSRDGEAVSALWESGAMDFGAEFQRKHSAELWLGLKPGVNSQVEVAVSTDRKSLDTVKLVKRKMADFGRWNFAALSFAVNRKPFMRRLRLKAKKFTYYKLILRSSLPAAQATVVAADIRVRYTGFVK